MTNGISFTYSIRILTSLEKWGKFLYYLKHTWAVCSYRIINLRHNTTSEEK
jgi:hypothetical protein